MNMSSSLNPVCSKFIMISEYFEKSELEFSRVKPLQLTLCPVRTLTQLPFITSNILIVLSDDPVAM